MQIMLVEDDALLADGIVRALKRDGFAVNWLSDGRSAQNSLVAEAPDVLVLDLGLPDMDGLDLLAWLRAVKLKGRAAMWQASAERILLAMTYGEFGVGVQDRTNGVCHQMNAASYSDPSIS